MFSGNPSFVFMIFVTLIKRYGNVPYKHNGAILQNNTYLNRPPPKIPKTSFNVQQDLNTNSNETTSTGWGTNLKRPTTSFSNRGSQIGTRTSMSPTNTTYQPTTTNQPINTNQSINTNQPINTTPNLPPRSFGGTVTRSNPPNTPPRDTNQDSPPIPSRTSKPSVSINTDTYTRTTSPRFPTNQPPKTEEPPPPPSRNSKPTLNQDSPTPFRNSKPPLQDNTPKQSDFTDLYSTFQFEVNPIPEISGSDVIDLNDNLFETMDPEAMLSGWLDVLDMRSTISMSGIDLNSLNNEPKEDNVIQSIEDFGDLDDILGSIDQLTNDFDTIN